MTWLTPLFVHLDIPRDAVLRRIPDGLSLDDGAGGDRASISLVALGVEGPAPKLVTASPLRRLVRYTQLNLRTYVIGPHGPGLFFLETRVNAFWPLLARLGGLPYRRDGALAFDADEKAVAVKSGELVLRGLPAPGAPAELAGDSPARRFLDRFVSYTALPYAVRVHHAPWRVRDVEVDPSSRLELGELGPAKVLSAQLAETVQVESEVLLGLPAMFRRRGDTHAHARG